MAILAAIALPAYQTYTKRAKFSEVVAAVGPVKTAIEVCVSGAADDTKARACGTAGANAAPAAYGNVLSVGVSGGVITATGVTTVFGSTNNTFTLTPTPTLSTITAGSQITWTRGGTCEAGGFC
nr:pilin [Aeromonas veronii]